VTRCTLDLAGELVCTADGGAFESEYALFDPADIELSAAGPGTTRETGYRTTAGEAQSRLAKLGVTRQLAEEALAAARPWIARAYARGAAARRIVDQLGPAELFDGRSYDAAPRRYAGAWLDLPELTIALSAEIEPARASNLLQALHLAALLTERPEGDPLTLGTAELTAQRRPGERTFKRVVLDEPHALVHALGALRRAPEREGRPEGGPGRLEILAWARGRAQRAPADAERLAAIEAALAIREPPARGPLADAELWAVETRLSHGEVDGTLELIEAIERRRGRLPGTMYLRARVALMAMTDQPQAIAERVSSLSTSMSAFHELHLLAAQAWAAAGDVRRAHAFARDLSEDRTASEVLRMQARDVLDATGRAPTAPEGGVPYIPKPPLTPSRTDVEVLPSHPPSLAGHGSAAARSADERARLLEVGLSLPPYRIEPRLEGAWPADAEREAHAELVETLSLPPGMQDAPPPHDEPPRTPHAARLVCTYLARELGREFRIRHALELRSDLEGLELAQRYLYESISGERARTTEEQREVMRNGAFLSELIARRLGARWIDLEPAEPGRWAMLVPSRASPDEVRRVWPFGRVLRFVAMRHKERDLVSYYLQLEAHPL
jgi:hypothetical protein